MLTLNVPDRGLCVGQQADLKINGKVRHVHWRDGSTLVLDGQPHDVLQMFAENGVMCFSLVPWPQGRK